NERAETTTRAQGDQSGLPSLPRLEGVEPQRIGEPGDIKEQVKRETERLNSYGWVGPEHDMVHIPIEVAMKKARAKLRARPGSDTDEFLQAPSSSSSGRVPRGGSK